MKEMFNAKIDSPQTVLTGAINKADTVIYIKDTSVLPEAPNIATIFDDRYTETIKYTGKTQNSLTGCVRGFDGASRDWAEGKAIARLLTAYDINTVKENIESFNNSVTKPLYTDTFTTKVAVTRIDTEVRKQLKLISVKGKTVFNLCIDGDCEDVSKWYITGIGSLDFTSKVFGSNSIKVTITNNANGGCAKLLSDLKLDLTKYYCISAYMKNGTLSGIMQLYKDAIGGGKLVVAPAIKPTQWIRQFIKLKPSDMVNTNYISVAMYGSTGQYCNVDGYMINEITEQEYNDVNYQPPPYTNSEISIENLEYKCIGKNLFDINTNVIQKDKTYGLFGEIKDNIGTDLSSPIKVKPNKVYYFNMKYIAMYDVNNKYLGELKYSMATHNDTDYVLLNDYRQNSPFKGWYFTEIETKAKIQYPMRDLKDNNSNEIVADEVDKNGILTKRIEKVVLDSNLTYACNSFTGYKTIEVLSFKSIYNTTSNCLVIKFNNKPLSNWIPTMTGDVAWIGDDGKLYLTVFNSDSGWGENYTPTADEIKALMMGWKMYQKDTLNNFNGVGTKAWYQIGRTDLWTDTLPTFMASENNFASYRLYYQKQTPEYIDLNIPNLVAEVEGRFVISSDYGIIPEVQYQLCDNLKSNVDELMVQVAKDKEYLKELYQSNIKKSDYLYPTLLAKWQYYVNNNKLYYTKIGKTVYCRGYLANKEIIVIPSHLFIFDEGYRPRTTFSIEAIAVDNSFKTYSVLCDIDVGGRFWVGYGIPADLRFVSFNFSFDVE